VQTRSWTRSLFLSLRLDNADMSDPVRLSKHARSWSSWSRETTSQEVFVQHTIGRKMERN
jgi:hypothetical protein